MTFLGRDEMHTSKAFIKWCSFPDRNHVMINGRGMVITSAVNGIYSRPVCNAAMSAVPLICASLQQTKTGSQFATVLTKVSASFVQIWRFLCSFLKFF